MAELREGGRVSEEKLVEWPNNKQVMVKNRKYGKLFLAFFRIYVYVLFTSPNSSKTNQGGRTWPASPW